MKKLCLGLFLCVMAFNYSIVNAENLSINDLMSKAKAANAKDNKVFAEREARFKKELAQRTAILNEVKSDRAREEKRSAELEEVYKNNEKELEALRLQLSEELGDLKELFGVIQQAAGEASANFKTSITSAQFPNRSEKLAAMTQKMSQTDELVSIDEIEGLWFELQNELVEQGKIVSFKQSVSSVSGEKSERDVTRVGVFNLVSDGKFVRYSEDAGLSELARQPQSRYLDQAEILENAKPGELVAFSVDPTQGQLLEALVESPSLTERIQQGGVVGYIILAMGGVAIIIALIKIVGLLIVGNKVGSQSKKLTSPSASNPLGRILTVYQDNKASDIESMELRLGEAIMKETPKLNSWLMALKIIAVVAPLMGLLGTVTGMIQTFQSITLFGSGDPKLMAGGISQALVTTVLGLCVAIPTVLMHTAAATRAKRIQEILEEQSTGMIAEHSEKNHEQ